MSPRAFDFGSHPKGQCRLLQPRVLSPVCADLHLAVAFDATRSSTFFSVSSSSCRLRDRRPLSLCPPLPLPLRRALRAAAALTQPQRPSRLLWLRQPMTSIELPAGLTSLCEGAFHDCSSLASIELPAGLTSLGGYAFEECSSSSMTSIELPTGLTSIGVSAFCDCSSLTSIELPAGLTSLGGGAFYGCSSLASIKLPAGLTSIGGGAFEDCSSMTSAYDFAGGSKPVKPHGPAFPRGAWQVASYASGSVVRAVARRSVRRDDDCYGWPIGARHDRAAFLTLWEA